MAIKVLNVDMKYGWVVLVLQDPFRLFVKATFRPIKPFSGIYTGVDSPSIPATVIAAQRNRSERPREVFSDPFNGSPVSLLIGAKDPAVKLIKADFLSG